MKRFLLFAICAQLVCVATALSWGRKGHEITAEIATRHLKPKAKKAIAEILDDKTLVFNSVVMDDIRSLPEYQHTSTWHYVNVDSGEKYEPMPMEEGGDVYGAVELAIEKLKDYRNLDDSTKTFYLNALIHFVADMHCPMHAGRKSDMGGNKVEIKWLDRDINLHKLWDADIIESTKSWSYTEWADNIDTKKEKEMFEKYCQTTPREWMDETVEISAQIYDNLNEDGDYSTYEKVNKYVADNEEILTEQLIKAGYRLAYILNEIFK